MPKGFALAEMLAAAEGPATGNEAANPAASGVVSMAFRRGFDRIIVTSRLRGDAARCAAWYGRNNVLGRPGCVRGRQQRRSEVAHRLTAAPCVVRLRNSWCRPVVCRISGASANDWSSPSRAMPRRRSWLASWSRYNQRPLARDRSALQQHRQPRQQGGAHQRRDRLLSPVSTIEDSAVGRGGLVADTLPAGHWGGS